MNVKQIIDSKVGVFGPVSAAVVVWLFLTASVASNAQTTSVNLSPDVQEIAKFG
jgi:hypothetical protein